jgi:hypothetical protein
MVDGLYLTIQLFGSTDSVWSATPEGLVKLGSMGLPVYVEYYME